jgi:hypothetical protein
MPADWTCARFAASARHYLPARSRRWPLGCCTVVIISTAVHRLWVTSPGARRDARCCPPRCGVPETPGRRLAVQAERVSPSRRRLAAGVYRTCGGRECRHRPRPPRGSAGHAPECVFTTRTPMFTLPGLPGRSAPCRSGGDPCARPPVRCGPAGAFRPVAVRLSAELAPNRTGRDLFSGLGAHPPACPPIHCSNTVDTVLLYQSWRVGAAWAGRRVRPDAAGSPTAR